MNTPVTFNHITSIYGDDGMIELYCAGSEDDARYVKKLIEKTYDAQALLERLKAELSDETKYLITNGEKK